MDFNQFAKEVHQNAVDHGWWDEERTFGDIVALCHSELSEALEEYRAGRPFVYGDDSLGDRRITELPDIMALQLKPEGIAVEMADCMIRILDWFGQVGLDVEDILTLKHQYNKTRPYRHGGKAL